MGEPLLTGLLIASTAAGGGASYESARKTASAAKAEREQEEIRARQEAEQVQAAAAGEKVVAEQAGRDFAASLQVASSAAGLGLGAFGDQLAGTPGALAREGARTVAGNRQQIATGELNTLGMMAANSRAYQRQLSAKEGSAFLPALTGALGGFGAGLDIGRGAESLGLDIGRGAESLGLDMGFKESS